MIFHIFCKPNQTCLNVYSCRKFIGVPDGAYVIGEKCNKYLDEYGYYFEDEKKAINLALVGSIKEDILPTRELVEILLKNLAKNYPNALKTRFDIDSISDVDEVLNAVCKKRGLLLSGGLYDKEKAISLILKEFKEGKLGRFSLEMPN